MFHRTVLNIAAGLIGSAVLFAAGAASAHARLVKSDPPANATVAAPKEYRRSIMGTPTAKLMGGAYKISWHAAAADDGHRTEGTLGFTVR